MTAALVSTAAMSVGAVAAAMRAHPAIPFLAFAAALAVLLARPRRDVPPAAARAAVATAVVAVVAYRHVFVASSGLAPDHVLAAAVVVGAVLAPRTPRWDALGLGAAIATYAVSAAILIAVTSYQSDAVVSAHGGAELLLAGRQPYEEFDLIAQLARSGLPPEYATPLDDGTRVRSLQYPALAFLVPAPLVGLGLGDLRALYLAELIVMFLVVIAAAPRGSRALALAACVGNLALLGQFVLAGVDPMFGLLLAVAWVLRERRASAAALGLAVAARQQAWLVAPFIVAWTWHRRGPREALVHAGIAAAVAALVHAPFLIAAPAAVMGGLLDSALQAQEPWGVGPSKLLADLGVGSAVPRWVHLAAAGGAYLGALAIFSLRRRVPAGPLVAPLMPLWLGWRALQSYFAFLPLFAILSSERAHGTALRSPRVLGPSPPAPPSARPGDER